MAGSHRISLSKASSVPGSKQTATLGSSTEAKPRVVVWGKLVDISLSPTLAGRDASIAWSFNISLRSVFARNVR